MADLDHKKMNEWAIAWAGTPKDSSEKYTALCYLDLQAKLEAEHASWVYWNKESIRAADLLSVERQRAEAAEQKLREVEAALRYIYDSTAEDGQWEESGVHNFVKAALAPERTVPISHADIPYMTIPPKPVISESLTINYPPDRTESAALQENGQLCNAKGTPTAPETRPASAADPVSPLLPGLERAAEIYPTYYIKHPDDSYSEANPQPSTAVVGTAPSQEGVGQGDAAANTICKHGKIVSGNGILFCDICQDAIRAEISRLKGEGSEP